MFNRHTPSKSCTKNILTPEKNRNTIGRGYRDPVNKAFLALCVVGSIALCVVTFFGIRARFVPPTPKSQTTKGKTVSVYVDDGTGTYRPNEDGTFPTDGYVLNTEKSGCANGGVLSQNPETKAISLSVSGSDQCHVYFDKEKTFDMTFGHNTFKINNLENTYANGNQQEMFAFTHPATAQTGELTDYRYIGSSPNNYITFNDETWRIIGVFTVEAEGKSEPEQLVKIIRDKSIGNLAWNNTKVDGGYTNEWTGGSLQTMLNETYLNTEGSFTYESVTILKGLSATARSQIAKVKYYLGGSNTASGLGGPDCYAFERGTTTYHNSRQTSITQSVGLMYPSDYIYTYANGVDDTCYTGGYNCDKSTPSNGWLFNSSTQWFQSPSTSVEALTFVAYSTGCLGSDRNVYRSNGVRPTVYLNSDIQLTGEGTQTNPYTIKLS